MSAVSFAPIFCTEKPQVFCTEKPQVFCTEKPKQING